jgi:uncharacterized tellurite resistance protein B-like protein
MFLNLLDAEQQRLFVMAARAVAEQDGKVADVEESLLDAVLAECEIDQDPGTMAFADLLTAIDGALSTDPHARNAFLLELAGVAVIDGEAHPSELAVLAQVGECLDVTEERLSEFVDFAVQARALVVRGRGLVATGDGA